MDGKKLGIIGIAVIAILFLVLSGLIGPIGIKTYSDDNISFNYSYYWTFDTNSKYFHNDLLHFESDPWASDFIIMKNQHHSLDQGTSIYKDNNITDVISSEFGIHYENVEPGNVDLVLERNRTINGKKSYEMTFQGNNWKFLIIIIEIEKAPSRSGSTNFGGYYTIFLGGHIPEFDTAKSDLEIVINSLEFK